ncbi:zinc finger domain-containing protein [Streptomyces sp. NPDC001493]
MNRSWCLAIGAATRRPCKLPRDECPHHGEDVDAHRCGVIGKNKRPCRWNTTASGPCPNHHFGAAADPPHRSAVKTAPPRPRPAARLLKKTPLQVVCPHCGADAGAKCRYPNGGETSFHLPRRKAATQSGS